MIMRHSSSEGEREREREFMKVHLYVSSNVLSCQSAFVLHVLTLIGSHYKSAPKNIKQKRKHNLNKEISLW